MFQKFIEKVLGSFKKDKSKETFSFPTSRPEDTIRVEPTIESISKQEPIVENKITEITVTETTAQTNNDIKVKKTRAKKENGSKTTKRKSK